MRFSFEKLEVWQRAIEFAEKVIRLSEQWNTLDRHYPAIFKERVHSVSIYSTQITF